MTVDRTTPGEGDRNGLNLGCGETVIEGFVNLDISPLPHVDVVFDLNSCATTALPFPDDHFEKFVMSHVLEHIRDPLPLLQELHRVARPDATLEISLPHGQHEDAWVDPTHVRPYYPKTFQYFGQPKYYGFDYGYTGDWDVVDCELRVSRKLFGKDTVAQLQQKILFWNSVVKEMVVRMQAVKPTRPRDRSLLKQINPRISFI